MSDAAAGARSRGMSLSAYARRIGVSQPYISRAVKLGKIPREALIDPDGDRLIDPDAADLALGKGPKDTPRAGATSPAGTATDNPSPAGAEDQGSVRGKVAGQRDAGANGSASTSRGGRPATGKESYTDVRTTREGWLAKSAELEYRKRAGELCETAAVQRAVGELAGGACKTLDQIPNRIAGRCAAESDPRKVHAIIDSEIRRVRNEIAAFGESGAESIGKTRQ